MNGSKTQDEACEMKWLPIFNLRAVPHEPIQNGACHSRNANLEHIRVYPIDVVQNEGQYYVVAGNHKAALYAHLTGSWDTPILCRILEKQH